MAASSWASVLDITSWCEHIRPYSHILSQEKARRRGGESLILFEATLGINLPGWLLDTEPPVLASVLLLNMGEAWPMAAM